MKHYIHLNNQLVSITTQYLDVKQKSKTVPKFMGLLDMSSTACVSGLTDSHKGKSIKVDP